MLDLNAVVADLDKMLRRVIGEDVSLVTLPGDELGTVLADRGQLEQVLVNLAVNARDAMPGGGKLTIETANVILTGDDVAVTAGGKAGPQVMLSVTDTGHGIPDDIRDHIFEPFFTTKDVASGTGLGLATVYAIVDQSGGSIMVSSQVGSGTTFRIYFPRFDATADVQAEPRSDRVLPAGTETVLLVEDDESVREVNREALLLAGYRVLSAASGDEALTIVGSHSEPIHLLLTDVIMPGMSGKELADHVRGARPQMKILFASGYTADVIARQGVLESGVDLIEKPVTPSTLAKKVREILDRPASV